MISVRFAAMKQIAQLFCCALLLAIPGSGELLRKAREVSSGQGQELASVESDHDIAVHNLALHLFSAAESVNGTDGQAGELSLAHVTAFEQSMEKALEEGKLPAGRQALITTMLTLMATKMKPFYQKRFDTMRQEMSTELRRFTTCTDGLVNHNKKGGQFIPIMEGYQKEFQACILNVLQSAGHASRVRDLGGVMWGTLDAAFTTGELKKEGLCPYIHGDWENFDNSGKVVPRVDKKNYCYRGTATVTAYTCEKKTEMCADYRNLNAYHSFDYCEDSFPKHANKFSPGDLSFGYETKGVPPKNCEELSLGGCCRNPDSSECDQFDKAYGNTSKYYSSPGVYKKAMYDYWDRMITLWDDAEKHCNMWCEWCKGNQTLCPSESPHATGACPTHHKVWGPTTAQVSTTTSTTTTYTVDVRMCNHCQQLQERMDNAACSTAMNGINACNDYKKCYMIANTTYANVYNTICTRNGDLELLKNQYYVALRMECLVLALKEQSGTSIKACIAKKPTDYQRELGVFTIDGCQTGWPPFMANSLDMCINAQNVSELVNMPGTKKYKNKWYRFVGHPKDCQYTCCLKPPANFVTI
eukprot:TRINITY_DN469_c0_g2_i1.p1 TRINITY_DN469_c0_g2~~TRINITY_DN469_c0_g2_i1.p1  ORF type:complete len:585 (-),score=83.16 TRINITY_DN469_c0_g2_i1:242-1996(-)